MTSLALTAGRADPLETQGNWQPPSFEITAADGVVFHYPQDLEGPTIVLFWATWCPYCRALMPHLQSILDEYGEGVRVLALNFKDDDNPAGYVAELGFDFRLVLQAEEVAKSWGVKGTPGLFLVDKSGRVAFSRGAIPKEAFRQVPGEDYEKLGNAQKAARRAPFWAARLRVALDRLIRQQTAITDLPAGPP
jgi:thiol-disulfide isomerase/thioredoxin